MPSQTDTDQQDTSTAYDESRSQSMFDRDFVGQIVGGNQSLSGTEEAWRAYFDLAEATLRTARRVSEVQVLHLMRQELIAEVTAGVVKAIKADPSITQHSGTRR